MVMAGRSLRAGALTGALGALCWWLGRCSGCSAPPGCAVGLCRGAGRGQRGSPSTPALPINAALSKWLLLGEAKRGAGLALGWQPVPCVLPGCPRSVPWARGPSWGIGTGGTWATVDAQATLLLLPSKRHRDQEFGAEKPEKRGWLQCQWLARTEPWHNRTTCARISARGGDAVSHEAEAAVQSDTRPEGTPKPPTHGQKSLLRSPLPNFPGPPTRQTDAG